MLELKGVQSGYGEGLALHGVSLSVASGEALGVLGRNGAGKTTLLKTVMGLLPARAGSIRLAERNLTNAAPFDVAAAGVGYVPQGREIFQDFTVEQNLLLGDLSSGREEIEAAYEMFPILRERATMLGGSLSGGQQQQLALARALMRKPKLLLLDEPSEGIQPSIVGQIAEILTTIAARDDITIILVEQNIDMVRRVCSRVVFLESGTVAASMSVAEMSNNPETVPQIHGDVSFGTVTMTDIAIVFLDASNYILILLLVALGLAIIFGLMNVINMAHGEFLMLGAYAVLAVQMAGGSFWLGLLIAPIVVGFIGLAVEEIVIRRIYHRVLDTILATWGCRC